MHAISYNAVGIQYPYQNNAVSKENTEMSKHSCQNMHKNSMLFFCIFPLYQPKPHAKFFAATKNAQHKNKQRSALLFCFAPKFLNLPYMLFEQKTLQDVVPFTGFEGPEKKLLLDFVDNATQGFRALSKEQWQELVLNHAKCTIISVTSNEHFDAYLLSESSLFVYPSRLVLKTCGTTTLLKAVESIMELAKKMNLFVRRVFYSRKNYVFPENQPSPHKSFDEEVKLLDNYFVNGTAFIIGALNGDHYHLYFADYSKKLKLPTALPHQTYPIVEMMMHELSQKKMANFFRNESFKSAQDTTDKTGISAILPGSTIDSFQFDPCGYSMNGLLNDTFSTIHITPESHCSYASYEANCPPTQFDKPPADYFDWLITNVIMVFKPKKFTITLFAHDAHPELCEVRKTSSCFDTLIPKLKTKYSLKAKTLYELPGQHNITLLQFNKRKKGSKTPMTPSCDDLTNQDMLAKQLLQ